MSEAELIKIRKHIEEMCFLEEEPRRQKAERLAEERAEETYHERKHSAKACIFDDEKNCMIPGTGICDAGCPVEYGGETMSTIREDGKPKYCADCKHDNTGENRTTHGATCNHPEAMNNDFFARDGYWCFVAKEVR